VLIQDRVVYMMANEPQNHFLQAINDLRQKDKEKAAEEISIGASYIEHITAANGGQEAQPSTLSKAVDQLKNDAKQVQGGQLSDPKQLSQDFAQANISLAEHFQSASDRSLQNKHEVRAGYQLDNAASALHAAMAWSGQSPDPEGRKAMEQARWSAAQLLGPGNSIQSTDHSQDRQANAGGQSGQSSQGGQGPQQASQALSQEIRKVSAQIAQNSSGQNQGSQGSGNASGRE